MISLPIERVPTTLSIRTLLSDTRLKMSANSKDKNQLVEENYQLRKLLLEIQTGQGSAEKQALALQLPMHKLTGIEARLFWILWESKKRTLTKEAVLDALYFESPEQPHIKIVDVFVCKLRRKLYQLKFPFRIDTVWGRGYALVPHDEEHAHLPNSEPAPLGSFNPLVERAETEDRIQAGSIYYPFTKRD